MILDSNVFFSLMKPASAASKVFELRHSSFRAPEFLKSELDEHEAECLQKSGLSRAEFDARRTWVESKITFVSVLEYKKFLKKAAKEVQDIDDVPYVALALSTGDSIWSNDAHLRKQVLVKVYSTKEIVDSAEKEK
jgi:predicted nucleic acid-binding protein